MERKNKQFAKKSPWASLRRTVNLISRKTKKKDTVSYLDRAQIVRLKSSIGKLKKELKDSQRTNLELEAKVLELEDTIAHAHLKLATISSELAALLHDLNDVNEP